MRTQVINMDIIEFRFIPIDSESEKAYPNFDIDKVYKGEHSMQFHVMDFRNIASEFDKNLKTFNANIEIVNDYEVICKNEKEYIQVGFKNVATDIYYALVGPIRQWLEWRKNNENTRK